MKFSSFVRLFGQRRSHRSSQRQVRAKARRTVPARKPNLGLEALEERTLLSVIPPPAILSHTNISQEGLVTAPGVDSPINDSSPSVAVDPLDPQKAVAVWTHFDPRITLTPVFIEGSYTTNAGASWQPFFSSPALSDPTTTNPTVPYAWGTDGTVAFDRNETFYILYSEHKATLQSTAAGAIELQKFSFKTGTPTQLSFTGSPTTNREYSNNFSSFIKIVHEWVGDAAAVMPTLAVDSGQVRFTDPETGITQNNKYAADPATGQAGNIYVAWGTIDTPPNNPPVNFKPNTIAMAVSSDGGNSFGPLSYVPEGERNLFIGFGGGFLSHFSPTVPVQRDTAPRLAVSQGTIDGRIAPGQVTAVWDDYGQDSPANLDDIQASRVTAGSSVEETGLGGIIQEGTANQYPVTVTNSDVRFGVVTDVDVTINMTASLNEMLVTLVPPPGSGLPSVPLFLNGVDAAGNTITGQGITGGTLGIINGFNVGTTFDQEAARSVKDQSATAPFIGHFRPEGFGQGLAALYGATLSQVNGTWTLVVQDVRADTPPSPPERLSNWTLRITSDMTPITYSSGGGLVASDITVALTNVRGAETLPYPMTSPAAPTGIGPAPVVAQDNTMGSFSNHQGRLYLAYVDRFGTVDNPTDNSDIFLAMSDDGGLNWTSANQVNDDLGVKDGFSEGNPGAGNPHSAFTNQPADISGRPQFQPQIVVDQATGTVALSFYDARQDAARSRVSTYLATSIDGGLTFSPQTFANTPNQAFDAITRQTVTLESIPDNESPSNPFRDTTFGYGDKQGLALYAGHLYPVWSGNENGGIAGRSRLDIFTAQAVIADGPRVISSTMGPVKPVTINDTVSGTGQPNLPIPATGVGGAGTTTSTLTINGDPNAVISSLTVNLSLTNTQDSDLILTLIAPDNTAVLLSNRNGGTGRNYTNTTFDDKSAVKISTGVAPFTGSFKPEQPLSALAGKLVNGTWKLQIQDVATGNTGTLTNWSLSIQTTSTFNNSFLNTDGTLVPNAIEVEFDRSIDPMSFTKDDVRIAFRNTLTSFSDPGVALNVTNVVDLNPATPAGTPASTRFLIQFDPTLALTQGGSYVGTYSYTIGPGIRDHIRSQRNDVIRAVDINNNPLPPQTFTVSPDPVPSPNNRIPSVGTGGTGTNQDLTESTITVPAGAFGAGQVVQKITVTIDLDHEFDADLDIGLIAPDGTFVDLSAFEGFGPGGYHSTVFDDAAATPIAQGTPPFTGSFRPESPLSAMRGKTPAGGWTLFIDDASQGNIGTLLSWSITITPGKVITTTLAGNLMDQNANAVTGEDPSVNPITGMAPGDVYAVPQSDPAGNITFTGNFFPPPYRNDTLPLIVAGPHIVSTSVPGNPPTSDNLVLGAVTYRAPAASVALAPNSTLNATITVPDAFSILGATLDLNISDPNDSDLTATLIAPDGTQILLFQGVGAGGRDFGGIDSVTNQPRQSTTFDDVATTAIQNGQAPFSGHFVPMQPLAQLIGKVANVNGGVWTLRIVNGSATNAGTLNSWSLNFQKNASVNSIDVVFDRNIDPATFSSSDIVRLVGPSGLIGPDRQFAALSVNQTIPDGNTTAPLVSTMTIPDNFTIDNLKVLLNIAQLRDSDLTAVLVGPDGTQVTLFSKVGGTGQNFSNTLFDDAATTPVTSGTAPFAGVFRVVDPNGLLLNAFRGKNIQGRWSLIITDDTAGPGGGAGILNSWSLLITPTFTITPNPPGTPANLAGRTFRIGFPTQTQSGTYSLVLGPDIRSTTGDRMDTNLNAGLDVLRGVNQAGSNLNVPVTYSSMSGQIGIQAGQKVVSTIFVPDDFLIQNMTVTLDISYTPDSDLSVALFAPDGTRVPLFTKVGGSGGDFRNTVFDDAAATPISSGGAPFIGRYQPQLPLSTFNTHRSGGGWRLEIIDSSSSGTTGTLNSWALTLVKPTPGTGLGEPIADQAQLSFRIFTLDPANPLARSTWTAVGPASNNTQTPQLGGAIASTVHNGNSGRVGGLAVDPSDPSGNTVYVGGASGGIWKTTNFLTTDPNGPTYVPLTDFGPTFALNIGSIAVFGRNNNPNQSIVIAATGEGDTGGFEGTHTSSGVGFLLSMDGGASWTLLDSTSNFDSNGIPLPINSPLRDHKFVGTVGFKVIIDPRPSPTGDVIIYAALSDPTDPSGANFGRSGIWRSGDTGKTWGVLNPATGQRLPNQPGDATDVIFDENSGHIDVNSNPTGNLDILYGAFRGDGVYQTSNQGTSWNKLLGGQGDPFIQDPDFNPSPTLPVANPTSDPNGAKGRIVLAKPAHIPNSEPGASAQNLLYQGWLYAMVVTPGNVAGRFDGLYVTKDFGHNWTKVQLRTTLDVRTGAELAIPTNDPANTLTSNTRKGDMDPFSGPPIPAGQGNYDMSLAVDPTNPNIVYVGGTRDNGASGFMRVDITAISDPYSLYQGNNLVDTSVSGTAPASTTPAPLRVNTTDPIPLKPGFFGTAGTVFYYPIRLQLSTLTQTITPILNLIHDPDSPFTNNTTILIRNVASRTTPAGFANSGAGVKWIPFDEAVGESTDQHELITIRDPLTGHARLIIGDDQGVFTAVDFGDGTLLQSLGSLANHDNPSAGSTRIVSGSRNGNLQILQMYAGAMQPSVGTGLANQIAGAFFYATAQDDGFPASDPNILTNGNLSWSGLLGDGTDVHTDQTGTGTLYQTKWPCCIDDGKSFPTDFFQVNGTSRTFGLVQSSTFPNLTHDPQWPDAPSANFAVNPLSPDQMVISSLAGRIFATADQGRTSWGVIAQPSVLDGTHANALAFGAPAVGANKLNNFIYAGTDGGKIFVTLTGGGNNGTQWLNISQGLDGNPVRAIVTNPSRGSHEAYAVTFGNGTSSGIYHMVDSSDPAATWVNITGNLFQIMHNPFGDSGLAEKQIGRNLTGANAGYLEAIVADWRYLIPDNPADPASLTHPVLYVAGEGGVYRSVDNGVTWTLFPHKGTGPNDVAPDDGAPADGGYLPNAHVTDLDLALGNVNPTTGRPKVSTGPDLLLASTYGRGAFAIRVAPIVFTSTLAISPAPNANGIIRSLQPVVTGVSMQSAFGNLVRIDLLDLSDPNNPKVIGTGFTDATGHFSVQVSAGAFKADGSQDGCKVLGVRATDDAGVLGNTVTAPVLTFTLDTTPLLDAASVKLDPASDSGVSSTDGITNVLQPVITGQVNQVAVATVNLYDETDPNNKKLIGTGQTDATGKFSVQVNPGVYAGNDTTDGAKLIRVVTTNGTSSTSALLQPRLVIDTAAPGVLSVGDATILEGNSGTTTVNFTVFLSAALAQPVTFSYTTVNGTALAGTDYVAASGTLTIPAGSLSATIPVTILSNTVAQGNRTFLVSVTDAVLGSAITAGAVRAGLARPTGNGTIVDDDTPAAPVLPSLSVGDVTVLEGTGGTTTAVFNIFLSRPSTQAVTFNYMAVNDTAVAGTDYTASSGTLTIPAGSVTTTIPVSVLPNIAPQPNRRFLLNINSATNAVITHPDGVGTIVDDDGLPPVLSIGDVTGFEGQNGTTAFTFTVYLSQKAASDVCFHYSTADGTASAGTDYTATAGYLVIPAGSTSVTITVPVLGNAALQAPDRTFSVNLTNPVNAQIARATGTGTIVDDDPVPSLSISDVTLREGTGGSITATFTVFLASAATQPVTFNFTTADGTAAAGSDYTATSGQVILPTGTTSATITVVVSGDALLEPNEAFYVNISNAVNAGIAKGQGVGIIIDNDATPPFIPDLIAADDHGSSNTDNITNVTTPTFTGTLPEPGGQVLLYADGVLVGKAAVSATGAYSVKVGTAPGGPVGLTDGIHVMTVQQSDVAGNLGSISVGLSITVDTVPPAAPSVPAMSPADDTGLSNSDHDTMVTTPHFQVSAEPGSTVQIFANGVAVGSGVADASGNVTIQTSPLADGTYSITAQATDVAGNPGPMSSAIQPPLTIDTKAPAAPSAPDLVAIDDTGASNTDNITRRTVPTFTGTGEAGAQVQLFASGTLANGTPFAPALVGQGIVDSAGNYSVTVSTPLADGTYTLTAKQMDPAGNLSVASAALSPVVIDTTANAPTLDLAPASDTGMSSTDHVTSVNKPVFSGNAEPNATVQIFINGSLSAVGTATGNGSYAITAGPLSDGTYNVTAQQIDAAGNVSTFSGALTPPLTIDTLPPTSPGSPSLDANSDAGPSHSDHITNVTRPTINGTAEPNSLAKIYATNVATGATVLVGQGQVSPSGTYSVTLSSPLPDGVYDITVVAMDAAGNSGPAQGGLRIEIRTVPPPNPSLKLDPSTDSGTPGDNITAIIPQLYDGTAAPSTQVTIREGATVLTSFKQDGTGQFNALLSLVEGTHTLTAESMDLAGNVSTTSLTVTIDSTALDSDRRFVRALYLQALGRSGSQEEWNYWVKFLSQPDGRKVVASGIEHSDEARTRLVRGYYEQYLGREAQSGEAQFWVTAFMVGATEEQVLSQILASTEYIFKSPDIAGTRNQAGVQLDESWIRALYIQLLHRQATANDVAYWRQVMPFLGGPAGVVAQILGSVEYRQDIVLQDYQTLLGRRIPPAPSEIGYWVAFGQDLTSIRVGIEAAPEYYLHVTGFSP